MKILTAIFAAALLGIAGAQAHEAHEHASGAGLFGQPPEYVHVLLNPLPVYGLALGILALGVILVGSASAWPALHYGQNAYTRVRAQADEPGQQWLDEHMERAEKMIFAFYVTAALAVAALVSAKKFPRAATPLAVATLVTAAASLGVAGWISKAGGQIRHPEFRQGSAPASTPKPEQHHEHNNP